MKADVSSSGPPLVELIRISKRYGDLLANDGIDLSIEPGEIHALLGENGAGKSTLVKILYGVIEPSAGEIRWEGRPVSIGSPVEARTLGLGMVFQHFSLFEEMTVAENIAVALSGEWSLANVRNRLSEISRTYGLALDADRAVWTLSAGERQRIEIVRCLLQNPRLLILDEPTSVLTPQEAEHLFVTLDKLSAEGCSILYISHKLEEVRRLCRRATILRAGRVVATIDPRASTAREIAALMVGNEVGDIRTDAPHTPQGEVLRVRNLDMPPVGLHGQALKDINLVVRAGEVVGIAGVAGNGQSELFAALSGERLAERNDAITIAGKPSGGMGIEARRRLSAAFVPEERLGHAAAPTHRLSENTLISHASTEVRSGFILLNAAKRLARTIIKSFDVRTPEGDPQARKLSGGNLQKFVIGREIIRKPKLLIVDQPTWGVDAGAARLIRQSLVDLARDGSAVLVVSQDLDELFEVADQMAVIHQGMLSPQKPIGEWTKEAIGLEMLGVAQAQGGAHAD
ncbi:ABC transporter ATP-binding protein [Microvirga guangxiensis]|uniref:Nucleoside ABC transporter ATP-binding protein n=1 Tax=Microvirga guangxiensis TaxID=549386 RepID=A0A1G5IZ46_9HYPH|nr:ABC transporter ATP-binding protein [Microvirga guangxiensis]SCY81373.1 nucleoside ABC transporter ATP-binding protein [Microvirga guangxiensis]